MLKNSNDTLLSAENGVVSTVNCMPKRRNPDSPIEGPYPQLAALVRKAVGDLSYRTVQYKTGVNHVTVLKMWHGHRAEADTIIKLARGLGVLPNPMLVAAHYNPIQNGGDVFNGDIAYTTNDPDEFQIWEFANGDLVTIPLDQPLESVSKTGANDNLQDEDISKLPTRGVANIRSIITGQASPGANSLVSVLKDFKAYFENHSHDAARSNAIFELGMAIGAEQAHINEQLVSLEAERFGIRYQINKYERNKRLQADLQPTAEGSNRDMEAIRVLSIREGEISQQIKLLEASLEQISQYTSQIVNQMKEKEPEEAN